MTNSPHTRAVLYARISQDDAGTEKGVGRQLKDCRQLADLRGFDVLTEYVENDVSAFSDRPEYERMMRDVAAGGVDVIVVYSTSRLWRNRTQRGPAIDTLGKLGVRIEAVSGPSLDLASATGRYLADVIAGGDTRESEEKGERVARAALERAQEGRANGVCPYGWRRVYEHDDRGQVTGFRDVEDPAAAAIVRELVERVADGESVRGLARELTERGVPSPTGKDRWAHSTVKRLVRRPANIAKRVYKGEVIGDAAWPAIVDAVVWQQAVNRFDDAPVQPFAGVEVRPAYLLTGKSGAGRCGVCGAELRVARRKAKRKRGPDKVYVLYTCSASSGCVGRSQPLVDELVEGVVVGRLSRPDAAGAFQPDAPDGESAAARAIESRTRLDAAAEDYAEGLIDRDQLRRITAKLRPQIEEAERQVRVSQAPPPVPLIPPEAFGDPNRVAEVWDGLDLDGRRDLLEALNLRVQIMPTQQGPGFDPESIRFVWEGGQ